MDTPEIIYAKLIELALEKSASSLSKFFAKKEEKLLFTNDKLKEGLPIYVKKCLRFAESISLYKSPDTFDLSQNSIQLAIRNQSRRFYSVDVAKTLDETDILKANGHQMLLGDPGAGKTTTLKRLVSKTFQILLSDETDSFDYSFPIVVRLSEISPHETLLTLLARQMGIEYDTEKKEIEYTTTEKIDDADFYSNSQDSLFGSREVEIERTKIVYEYKLGNYLLKDAMGEYLNQMNTIIFLDGLDEINFVIRDAIFTEIKELSNLLTESKIILTSRYLQEISSFKKFSANSINPLSTLQKKELADLWLEDSETFLFKLEHLPYQDLADRPLFLTFLLRLFKSNNHELPEKSVEVYRQIVLLAIKEWDDDKEIDIRRYSKYKTFSSLKKEEFLSAIAFELTYSQNVKKTFDHNQLRNAFVRVHGKYPDLTLDDRTEIIRDIEAHNGLIIESSPENFEFSHLSLQEYLCAKYLLALQITRKHHELLNVYPAPFAIANVMCPEPETWFSTLFLTNLGETKFAYIISPESLFEYLHRLLIEKIAFPKPTAELGLAVLSLFFTFEKTKVLHKLVQFSHTRFIYESVRLALKYYTRTTSENHYEFTLLKEVPTDCFLTGAEKGSVSKASIKHLIQER